MLTEICHCGHDKASHYLDQSKRPPERATCLARGCDCRFYAHEGSPRPKKQATRPAHPTMCQCQECVDFWNRFADEAPKTPRIL